MAEQTSTKVTITTMYGDTNGTYDHLLASETVTVTASNYKTYSQEINTTASDQATAIENTNAYKMLNSIPDFENDTSYNTQGVWTDIKCGISHDYRAEVTNGNQSVDVTEAIITIKYRVTNSGTNWGTFKQSTLTFTNSNYTNAENDIVAARDAGLDELKAYLNTLIGTIPETFGEQEQLFTTTVGSKTFKVTTSITKGAVEKNIEHNGDSKCTLTYTTVYSFDKSASVTYSTKQYVVNSDNYLTYEALLAGTIIVEQNKIKQLPAYKMLNITFPAEISDSYVAKNGITYQYKTTFTQGTADLTQNQVGYITVWGTNTNYGQTYGTALVETFDTATYVSASSTLVADATAQTNALKTYLDTLLGPIQVPNDLTSTKPVASGKTFTIKTVFSEFSKSSSTNITEYVIQYQTVYGLNKYDQTMSTLNHTITINNYATYQADLNRLATEQHNKVEQLASYKMLNQSVPGAMSGEVTATNGIKYYYITQFSQGNADLNSNTIKYTTKYGLTKNYETTYTANKTVSLDTNTYTSTTTLCEAAATNEQNDLKDFLNTLIGQVNKPGEQTTEFKTVSGQTFYVKTSFNRVNETNTQYDVEIVTQYSLDSSYQANIVTYSTLNHSIVASNYQTYIKDLNDIASAEQQKIKTIKSYNMLNINVPADSTGEYEANNGTTYFYKISFNQGTADLSTNTISGTIQYGTNDSYGIIYSTTNVTLTTGNYTNAESLLTNARTTLLDNLEGYLDTLTGRLTVPEALTKTYNTNSGSILYGRVNFLITEDTETKGVIQYTTEYGLTPNYGSIFSVKIHEITSANYTEYLSELSELGNNELTQLGASRTFSMLNITRPQEITGEYEATNGVTYFYRVAYPQGIVTVNSNAIKYVTTYGTSESYGNTYSDKALVFDTSTYTTATSALSTESATEIESLKQYLNTLNGAIEIPAPKTTTIPTRSGQNIYARVVYNKKSESDTEYVIQYTTEYGLNTNYGTSFSTKLHSITATNYSNYSIDLTNLANAEFEAIKTSDTYGMLNIALPDAISSTYHATNGLTYNYRIRFVQGSADAIGNTITYITEYGTSSSYGTIRSTKSVTFIQSTYKDAHTVLDDAVSSEIDSLKNYLDTVIGKIEVPIDKITTFPVNSGAVIHAKVTFAKKSESATQCIMQYTTEYGTSNNYGSTFSVKTHTIIASNYNGYSANLNALAESEFVALQNSAVYNMLNIKLPAKYEDTYIATNGLTYFYKITYTQGEVNLVNNTINFIINWGTSSAYGNTWGSQSVTFNTDNYNTASITLLNRSGSEVDSMKSYLDTLIGTISLPSAKTTNWDTLSGKPLHVRVNYTKKSESATQYVVEYQTEYGFNTAYGAYWSTKTVTITSANYGNYLTILNDLANNEIQSIKDSDMNKMLNVQVPNSLTGLHNASNGRTYFYKTTFTQGTVSLESNTINYTTVYGLTSDYGNTFSSKSVTANTSNYNMIIDSLNTNTANEHSELKTFLDTLIEQIILPNTYVDSWVTTSGKTMYVRTTFNKKSQNNTLFEVVCETEYGLTNSYGTIYSSHTHVIRSNNYATYSKDLMDYAKAEQDALRASGINGMLNVAVPDPITGTTTATNGLKYYYKVEFAQGDTTLNSNEITYTTFYGTSINYGTKFSTSLHTITASNYTNALTTLTSFASGQISDLKTYLNSVIGEVSLPSPKTEIYTTSSGKKFYLKTTFTKDSSDASEFVVRYTTVWGTNTNYGNTFTSKTHTIIPTNYQTYISDLESYSTSEFAACKVNNFKIWDVVLPNPVTQTFTNKGDETFYLKVSFIQGSTTDTQNNIGYVTTYGTTPQTNGATQFTTKVYTVDNSTVASVQADLVALANVEIGALQAVLQIPDIILPTDSELTYTKNGFKYRLSVTHEKGEKVNMVTTAAFIDGNAFGLPVTNAFNSQAQADSALSALVSNKMDEMKNVCDQSPADTSEDFAVGGSHFQIQSRFEKAPGNVSVTITTLLDGAAYKITNQNVEAGTITQNLTTIDTVSTNAINSLKSVLSTMPVTNTITHTVGGFNFSINASFAKVASTSITNYTVYCDNVEYAKGEMTVTAGNLVNNINAIAAIVNDKITELKGRLNTACPSDSAETVTYNGFKYMVNKAYTKSAGTSNATVTISLDAAEYNSAVKAIVHSSLDTDINALVVVGEDIRNELLGLINQSPANTTYTYPVNGFNFTMGTIYRKAAGSTNVTIDTMLDGRIHQSVVRNVAVTSITANLNECMLVASEAESNLKSLADGAPANTNRNTYEVNGFTYYVGATYTKLANENGVVVNIMLDNEVNESYNESINAGTIGADITRIIRDVDEKVTTLKTKLGGLTQDSVTYTKNGFSWSLYAIYAKDPEAHTITITTKIDDTTYGPAWTTTYNPADLEAYKTKAQSLMNDLKNILDAVPADSIEDYNINGFSFTVGASYEKAKDSDVVYIYSMLDNKKIGLPNTLTFNPDNINAIGLKGSTDIATLKERLNGSPANYSNIFTIGGMQFRIGTTFSKPAGQDFVTITTLLDNEAYGSVSSKQFILNDLSNLTLEATAKEEELKDILRTSPQDSTEIYTVRRLNFSIQKLYTKPAGSKLVTTLVKLDGNQYEAYHQENFDINNISNLTSYNDSLAESLKVKLSNSIPNDIHTTYSRNQFTFVVDIYFTKEANSDVVQVEYTIDSADLANSIDSGTYSGD